MRTSERIECKEAESN